MRHSSRKRGNSQSRPSKQDVSPCSHAARAWALLNPSTSSIVSRITLSRLPTHAASLGIVAGAGGTYPATSGPKVGAQAISKAELVAAISADPSLCPIPTVEAPAEAEALSAHRKAYAASPLVWDRDNLSEISLALGQCDKASTAPGIACMTSVKMSPRRSPLTGLSASPNRPPANGSQQSTK